MPKTPAPVAVVREPVIDIVADAPITLPVRLVGIDYEVHPPKSAISLQIAKAAQSAGSDPTLLFEIFDDWLASAFGKKEGAKIQARLLDSDDALDYQHLMLLLQRVVEATTPNPTS